MISGGRENMREKLNLQKNNYGCNIMLYEIGMKIYDPVMFDNARVVQSISFYMAYLLVMRNFWKFDMFEIEMRTKKKKKNRKKI